MVKVARMGRVEELQGLKSLTDKGRVYFYFCYYHLFFSFKLLRVIIQRKIDKNGNKFQAKKRNKNRFYLFIKDK